MDLSEYGIDISIRNGNQKTYCPQCRGSRKSKNRHDKPLSVTIDDDKAVWNCHNCNWKG
jgi:transposase-like protein